MAENQNGEEKTEQATARRLIEARERGQVSKSNDVTTAAVLLLGGVSLFLLGKPLIDNYRGFMTNLFFHAGTIELTTQNVSHYFFNLIAFLGQVLLPIVLAVFVISIISEISQVGLKVATKKFSEPQTYTKMFKIGQGLKKIFFSSQSLFELVKSIAKILVIGVVVWTVLRNEDEEVIGLIDRPFMDIGTYMARLSFELVWKVGLTYIAIAIADHFFQKWKFAQDMKMTKKEVKEERKQSEGDPMVKSRLRSLMRGRIRSAMLKNAEEADVVITNPTHFSVALKYKQGQSSAPIVVAKGVDFLAMKIRLIAGEKGIPIIEDPPVARAIYFSVDVDREIPETLFKAVAQILAYVYQLKTNKKVKYSPADLSDYIKSKI